MTSKKWQSILVVVLLVVAVTEFGIRGPLRIAHGTGWNDFLFPYIQAKAWAHGEDPYSPRSLISDWPSHVQRPPWVESDAASGLLELKRGIPTPYPLSSLVVLSPFTVLPWSVAITLWIVISTGAAVLSPFALISLCGVAIADLRAQVFLVAVFALTPLHTGLGTANPAMLAISLTVAAVWAEHRGKLSLAGALLAVAVCLKPTVAGGVLLYYLVRRRWRVTGIACAIAVAVAGLAVLRFQLAGVPWMASYIENTHRIFAAGSLADFARPDAIRFNMINAQVLFYSLLGNAPLANRLAQLLGAGLLGLWLWLCYRQRAPSELLEISAISVLSLISVYHRFYDAAVLIWPLAWCLLLVERRSVTILITAMIAPFLMPGPAVLTELASTGRIPSLVVNGWWWNAIVLPHEVWFLIFLTLLLLGFMFRPEVFSEHPPAVSRASE